MSNTAPTYAEFIELHPEFTSSPSQPVVENFLARASRMFDEAAWGEYYSDAIELEVAHNCALNRMAGNGATGSLQAAVGPITSVSGAGLSTSFATPQSEVKNKADLYYMKTSYGQQYLLLRDSVIPMTQLCGS